MLDPQRPPLCKIFGLLEFLEHKKHKMIGGGEKFEFLWIFQKSEIFEKITNFFQKSNIITPWWLKVS